MYVYRGGKKRREGKEIDEKEKRRLREGRKERNGNSLIKPYNFRQVTCLIVYIVLLLLQAAFLLHPFYTHHFKIQYLIRYKKRDYLEQKELRIQGSIPCFELLRGNLRDTFVPLQT